MNIEELIDSVEGNLQQYDQTLDRIQQSGDNSSSQLTELLKELVDIQEEVVDFRLKKILREENPYLPAIHPEKIRHDLPDQQFSLTEIQNLFLTRRRELVRFLNLTPAENWSRTGVHELEGHITFKELIRRMIEKDKPIIARLNKALRYDLTADFPKIPIDG